MVYIPPIDPSKLNLTIDYLLVEGSRNKQDPHLRIEVPFNRGANQTLVPIYGLNVGTVYTFRVFSVAKVDGYEVSSVPGAWSSWLRLPCPAGGYCLGNSEDDLAGVPLDEIFPLPGYWRVTWEEYPTFVRCPAPARCLGGNLLPKDHRNQTCEIGTSGLLCASCSPGFGHSTGNSLDNCRMCDPIALSAVGLVLSGVFVGIGSLFFFLKAGADHHIQKRRRARARRRGEGAAEKRYGLLRCLLRYLQMLYLVASFADNPRGRWSLEGVAGIAGALSTAGFYQFTNFCGASNDFTSQSRTALFLLPLIFAAFFASMRWLCATSEDEDLHRDSDEESSNCATICSRSVRLVCSQFRSSATAVALGIAMFAYPVGCTFVIAHFACSDSIAGRRFLLADYKTECSTSSHLAMIFTTAIPAAVLWVLSLPALMVYTTKCGRRVSGNANDEGDMQDERLTEMRRHTELQLDFTDAVEEGVLDGARSLLTAGYKTSTLTYREAVWCVRIALLSVFTTRLLPSYFSLIVIAGGAFEQAYSKPFSTEFEVLGQAEVLGLATMFSYSFAVNMIYVTTPLWLVNMSVIASFTGVAVYLIWLLAELWYSFREDKSTSLITQMISSSAEGERLSVSLTSAEVGNAQMAEDDTA